MKDKLDVDTLDWVDELYETVKGLQGQVTALQKRVRKLEREADFDDPENPFSDFNDD